MESGRHQEVQPDTVEHWHCTDADLVMRRLETNAHGLTRTQADRRLQEYGPNTLRETARATRLATLLNQFRSPLITILLVATALTLFLREFIDSAVIAVVLILNAGIGYVQERRAEQSVRALMGMVAPHATVVREGRDIDVDSSVLVPGDVVLLESGARVPADLRLVSVNGLSVDESLLTGESLPVRKVTAVSPAQAPLADRTCMVFTGSIVAAGRGRGVVVATGDATELGNIAEQVRGVGAVESPLQHRMRRFAHLVGAAIGLAAVATFGLGIALGESVSDMFLVAVALAVAAVPEGLPVVLTIALALGVRRMAKRNAIIRRLPAVETLGSTTLIGSDKTGTLTENRMTVAAVWAAGMRWDLEGDPAAEELLAPSREFGQVEQDPLIMTLLAGVLANEGRLHIRPDGFEVLGDPTETALLVSAARLGVDPGEATDAFPVVADIPFESERGYSASIRAQRDRHLVFVKGAPERVLAMSDRVMGSQGGSAQLLDQARDQADAMAAQGLRVLAMAYRPLTQAHVDGEQPDEPHGLTFLGLQGMIDPPRRGVREAIAGCQSAGIRVVMITGDHAVTASAVAEILGIAPAGSPVLQGNDIEDMGDEELLTQVENVCVFARVSPEHKLRIVQAARALGHVVAVTGDGVNDAPALNAADIGIAMGRSGTDVAREAADMVLTDDNFSSIFAAVEEGRVTFDNIRKVTFFLMSTGVASLVLLPVSLVLGLPLPLLPAQLLWMNLVTNGLQDVALAFEPEEKGVLERAPRAREEPVVSRLLWERAAVAGGVMAAASLFLFQWALEDRGETYARTLALTTLVLAMAFHVGSSRSEHRSILLLSPWSNPFLLSAQIGALVLHAGSLHWGPTQFVLRVEPLDAQAWVMALIAALLVLVSVEIHKLARRPRRIKRAG
jgi:magnesium-transporting ATPase (P-type)